MRRVPLLFALFVGLGLVSVRADVVRTGQSKSGSRLLYATTTPVATVGTGLETLASYTLPGGTLNAAGDGVRYQCWGLAGATASNNSVETDFGGTRTSLKISTAANAILETEASVWRVTATTQTSRGTGFNATANETTLASPILSQAAPGETLSGDVVIACKCQSTTAGNWTLKGFVVWLN